MEERVPRVSTGPPRSTSSASVDGGRRWRESCVPMTRRGSRADARMRALGVCRVAIERPDGLLVERLLEAGFTVLRSTPTKLRRPALAMRPPAASPTASTLLSWPSWRAPTPTASAPFAPDRDETKALRALTRTREDLVGARVRLANELRAQLGAFWPGARSSSPMSTARSRSPSWTATRAGRHKWPRREAPCRLPRPPSLLGTAAAPPSSGAAARGAPRPGGRAGERGPARRRARPGRRLEADRRPDPRSHLPDRPRGSLPCRRTGLPAAVQRPQVVITAPR